jgi:2-polyprenyl-6-methoxyphenol hydroxylase-like FAD-dependent oxidoreductase
MQLQDASQGVAGTIELISERAVWPLQLAKAARWVGSMPGFWHLANKQPHRLHWLATQHTPCIRLAGQGLNVGLGDVMAIGSRDSGQRILAPLERCQNVAPL